VSPDLAPGLPVSHPRLGAGVVIAVDAPYARVFFRETGEQVVTVTSLDSQRRWEEQIVSAIRPATPDALRLLHLALEACDLPLHESSVALTAAKVDLLPHQLVLTHKIATAPQRRFLIADDVGLGKTIETALVLRELASRDELTRSLMVVPAGLVENWRRELNDVFRLDFEVFGSEGDVTDRKTNAFAKHNRLIASIDTLKRPERMKRLADAPAWDLVVFDEAQHLTATRSGTRVKKTDNYRLGELLRDHARNLLLLSATPHQGDHFRFLALIRLLHPTLFQDEQDMLNSRYRLNAVVIRRTKADACRPDGSPLFARRQVHSLLFSLSDEERAFYAMLTALRCCAPNARAPPLLADPA
jgi:SNF2 family DNA or RNA helicase